MFLLDEKKVAKEIGDCPRESGLIDSWVHDYEDIVVEWRNEPLDVHAAAKSASTGGWVKKHVTPSWAKEFLPERLRC